MTGQDLGGLTLTSGVYTFSTSAQLTGTLTLDAQNNHDSVFIFQIGSTLTTASNSSVVVINAPPNFCNKYWQVGSSATLGTDTQFVGNILALQSITLNTGASVYGRLFARNGAVTLDSNVITNPACTTSPTTTTTLLSATSITLGQSITDTATVTGSDGSSPVPTGTVTFRNQDRWRNNLQSLWNYQVSRLVAARPLLTLILRQLQKPITSGLSMEEIRFIMVPRVEIPTNHLL